MLLFALNTSVAFGEKVAAHLNIPLAQHEEREFEDGEHKIRPLENVRGRDVFVIHSLFSEPGQSVNDKICRLLFFIGALRDASAGRLTIVVPYFAYARKDRKTKSRDPVTMKYMAQMLEAAGAEHLLTMDIHNLAAFQNAFRIPVDHLEARVIFISYLAGMVGNEKLVVVSPDVGGFKRMEKFCESLSVFLGNDINRAFLEKRRSEGKVSGEVLVGDVQGRVAIIIDDIVSSGTTLNRAIHALQQHGAQKIFAAASHGIFVGKAAEFLAQQGLEKLFITDSIPPFRLAHNLIQEKITVVSVSALFAEAIRRIHEGNSVSELSENIPSG